MQIAKKPKDKQNQKKATHPGANPRIKKNKKRKSCLILVTGGQRIVTKHMQHLDPRVRDDPH
jgi:hypothetical protein